ncbi:MAG TPA: radical SAM protein [Gemmataceae bacterium]|jgi:23S rRNA (adenine2503-C2)-methyltransferase|nr:radical SAM protein [Gemmataceae bacterium]
MLLLKDHTAEELHAQLADLGVTARLARRLQAAVFQRRAAHIPAEMPEVPRRVLERVRQATAMPRLTVLNKAVSPRDGFTKYLFRGDGPEPFEAVRIPLLHRPKDQKYVVCVSSQVGCALGCAFCATARLGFKRNLAAWEIVDQVMHIQADSPHPVRGVVFMGMGEPMLNYERVMRAARILSEPCAMAIDAKAITISTVGVVPMIRRYTAERRPYRLVVSLTSADPDRRRELLPIEASYPMSELIDSLWEYHRASGRRVTLAWTLMSGINTRVEDARRLAKLTAGLPVIIDLIDVNDPTGRFRPPSADELNIFRDALTAELGMPVVRRYSGGQDIDGGCGMLAGKAIANEE